MLVVEDEADLGELIAQLLRAEGWACDLAPTIAEAELLHRVHDYALVVLDRQLPDGDGLDACRRWRASGSTAAVLLLTAMNANEQVVDGLNAGADDHLGKPFDSAVLIARIQALLRRRPTAVRRVITVGALSIDRERRQVTLHGDLISLTPKEFALLEMLALADHAVIDRLVLLEQCWDHAYEPGSNVVDVHVAALRRKLGRGWIETSRGAGYRLAEAGA